MLSLRSIFDLSNKQETASVLEKESHQDDFWSDQKSAREKLQELKRLKSIFEPWLSAEKDAAGLLEFADIIENDDNQTLSELETEALNLKAHIEELELRGFLSDKDNIRNCYLQIHPGAGGTESCDWAEMLVRMYSRWAENKRFKMETEDLQPGDETGVKNILIHVVGEYAYGYLKSEIGIHRLVRISPFDSNKRRHTSFASVYVYPEIDDDIEIEISEADLRIDTFRSSGPGGQHVNVTDSAVRITHLPTGIVVQCQSQRSQHKNRETAMKVLRARIYQQELQKRKEEKALQDDSKKDISWGNQIRSYVFHPYNLVKDLRTKAETSNTTAVMDGDIDMFINEYLRQFGGD